MVLLEQRFVHSGLVIKPFQVGLADQFDQVLIPGTVRGQEDQVIIIVVGEMSLLGQTAAGGQIGLTAKEGFHPCGLGFLIELDRSEHVPVVRDRDRRHVEALDLSDQRSNSVGPIQQAVVGMEMKVDEFRSGRHGGGPQPSYSNQALQSSQ